MFTVWDLNFPVGWRDWNIDETSIKEGFGIETWLSTELREKIHYSSSSREIVKDKASFSMMFTVQTFKYTETFKWTTNTITMLKRVQFERRVIVNYSFELSHRDSWLSWLCIPSRNWTNFSQIPRLSVKHCATESHSSCSFVAWPVQRSAEVWRQAPFQWWWDTFP